MRTTIDKCTCEDLSNSALSYEGRGKLGSRTVIHLKKLDFLERFGKGIVAFCLVLSGIGLVGLFFSPVRQLFSEVWQGEKIEDCAEVASFSTTDKSTNAEVVSSSTTDKSTNIGISQLSAHTTEMLDVDPTKMLDVHLEARSISSNKPQPSDRAYRYSDLIMLLPKDTTSNEQAMELLNKAREAANPRNIDFSRDMNLEIKTRFLRDIASGFQSISEIKQAIETLNQALDAARDMQWREPKNRELRRIACDLYNCGQRSQALEIYSESLTIAGISYFEYIEIKHKLEYFIDSVSVSDNRDKILEMLNKVDTGIDAMRFDLPDQRKQVHEDLAKLFEQIGESDKADKIKLRADNIKLR